MICSSTALPQGGEIKQDNIWINRPLTFDIVLMQLEEQARSGILPGLHFAVSQVVTHKSVK